MDKKTANILLKELEKAAQAIASKHGLTLDVLGGSVDETSFKPSLRFKGLTDDGQTAEEQNWDNYYSIFGLKKEWLGKQYDGKTIIGLDMKKRKYPVMLKDNNNGRRYKTSADSVIRNSPSF